MKDEPHSMSKVVLGPCTISVESVGEMGEYTNSEENEWQWLHDAMSVESSTEPSLDPKGDEMCGSSSNEVFTECHGVSTSLMKTIQKNCPSSSSIPLDRGNHGCER